MEKKELAKQKAKEEAIKRHKMIANQWQTFSKQQAFKELMDYIEMQNEFAITGAKGPVNTFMGKEGEETVFDLQKASVLLQRSVGYDIVRTYIEGYTNPDML